VNPVAERYAERLLIAGVAGTNTSHRAQDNLYKTLSENRQVK
jgi:hypothetical protein